LTYFFEDTTDIAVNVIGGVAQEVGVDYYTLDGRIKWDGMSLEDDLSAGDILRVFYRARGLSLPVPFRISLSDGFIEVWGHNEVEWNKLMRRRLLSDTTAPWSTSFYMNQTVDGLEHPGVLGNGYVSKYVMLADGIQNTVEAVPNLIKTWRQPVILSKPAVGNP
jgi:hypothetical protein